MTFIYTYFISKTFNDTYITFPVVTQNVIYSSIVIGSNGFDSKKRLQKNPHHENLDDMA